MAWLKMKICIDKTLFPLNLPRTASLNALNLTCVLQVLHVMITHFSFTVILHIFEFVHDDWYACSGQSSGAANSTAALQGSPPPQGLTWWVFWDAVLLTMVVKSWLFEVSGLSFSNSSSQSGYFSLTAFNKMTFLPSVLLLTGCFLGFTPFYINSKDCVYLLCLSIVSRIPKDEHFLKYSNQAIWHQQ